jgi:uncharacterized RmlC-like cupin family protein
VKDGENGDVVIVHPEEQYDGKQGHTFFAGVSRQSAGSRGLCLHLITIPPGVKDNPHMHLQHESAIYVLQGRVEGWSGEGLRTPMIAEAGDFVYVPAGVPHQPINASQTEPLIALIARTDPDEQESVVLLPDPRD